MHHRLAPLFLLPLIAHGALLRIDVSDRRDVLNGQPFGTTGAYELIRGQAQFAVDPAIPPNSRIVDLRFAPRSPRGSVEFSADIVILRPKFPRAGNGTLLLETPNRGGMGMLATYNRAKSSTNPTTAEHFGDGYLLREGYTLAWIGWQHDVPEKPGALRAHVPNATGIKGLVRGEFTPSVPTRRFSLGDNGHIPYKVNPPESLQLTVRDGIHGPRSPMPANTWRLDNTDIVLANPAAPGRIYEFVYQSKDPAVAGLGLAAIRDFVSECKHGARSIVGSTIRHALGVGTSQSAMALKALVYEGFNADEQGRIVFDGLQPNVAGGRRATFERFSQPSRTAGPLRDASFSTTDQFPFSDAEVTELATSRKDSILTRAKAAGVVPRILYTNSSYEYWGSAGALVHTSLDGKRDLPLPATTRLYLLAGGQHGPAAFPPQPGRGQNLANWNDYKWALRAILRDLHEWVAKGIEPPPSAYPKIQDGTLAKGDPPAHRTQFLDFGPDYREKGIVAYQPPRPGLDYAVLVPKPDANGNDSVGVKMPWVAVPLGAFTGWNLRTAAIGAEGALLANTGSYLPFAALRVRTQFTGRAAYAAKIEEAAAGLIQRRFLLQEDLPRMIELGGRIWDWSISGN